MARQTAVLGNLQLHLDYIVRLPFALRRTAQPLCSVSAGTQLSLHLDNSYLHFGLHLKCHFSRKAFLNPADRRLASHPLPTIFSNYSLRAAPCRSAVSFTTILPNPSLCLLPPLMPFETRESLALYSSCYVPNPEFFGDFQSVFTDWK